MRLGNGLMTPSRKILNLSAFHFTKGMAFIGHDGLQYRVTGLGRVDRDEVKELDLGDVTTATEVMRLIEARVGTKVSTHRVDDGTYLISDTTPWKPLCAPCETWGEALYETLAWLSK